MTSLNAKVIVGGELTDISVHVVGMDRVRQDIRPPECKINGIIITIISK